MKTNSKLHKNKRKKLNNNKLKKTKFKMKNYNKNKILKN